jgi:hypothetical protein
MTAILNLRTLDDHETVFQALAQLIHDTQEVTKFLDQRCINGDVYPMHLELTGLEPRQIDLLRDLLRVAPGFVDHFTSTIEQVSVS